MAKDFRLKKYKLKKVGGGYQYEGINPSGKKFTSKVYSTESSARRDVQRQNRKDYLNKQRVEGQTSKPSVKPTPKATAPKKNKAIGGRSPLMDKMVSKYGPSLKKKGMSQYDISTMAKNVVEGGDVDDWRKRYKAKPKTESKPKPKPKKRVVGYEKTSTWSGKASEARDPKVSKKKLYGDWLDD